MHKKTIAVRKHHISIIRVTLGGLLDGAAAGDWFGACISLWHSLGGGGGGGGGGGCGWESAGTGNSECDSAA